MQSRIRNAKTQQKNRRTKQISAITKQKNWTAISNDRKFKAKRIIKVKTKLKVKVKVKERIGKLMFCNLNMFYNHKYLKFDKFHFFNINIHNFNLMTDHYQ